MSRHIETLDNINVSTHCTVVLGGFSLLRFDEGRKQGRVLVVRPKILCPKDLYVCVGTLRVCEWYAQLEAAS